MQLRGSDADGSSGRGGDVAVIADASNRPDRSCVPVTVTRSPGITARSATGEPSRRTAVECPPMTVTVWPRRVASPSVSFSDSVCCDELTFETMPWARNGPRWLYGTTTTNGLRPLSVDAHVCGPPSKLAVQLIV